MKLLHGNSLEVLKTLEADSVDSLVTDPPAGISFMGKAWDDDMGGRTAWVNNMKDIMQECLRVLKPGAHALVWAIPRTSHWTATALEDAGFEIRDVVTHLFGSGFPKSMNISIAIDKQAGAMGARGRALVTAGKGEREDLQDNKGNWTEPNEHEGITPEAKTWQGWGTALKPASEHWILARKPLSEKTVAANTLKHGTGGLNIDASRIEGIKASGVFTNFKATRKDQTGFGMYGATVKTDKSNDVNQGRFPANLVLSHLPGCISDKQSVTDKWECDPGCAVAALNEQSGDRPSRGEYKNRKDRYDVEGNTYKFGGNLSNRYANESGGASRFFYVAKASKKDKGTENTHPTVKSSTLMSYLIKLITPPGGLVLDPFMGSGSTGVAAQREGFRFIGIEQEAQYLEIAKKRIVQEVA